MAVLLKYDTSVSFGFFCYLLHTPSLADFKGERNEKKGLFSILIVRILFDYRLCPDVFPCRMVKRSEN
jgi:hypothetical protein